MIALDVTVNANRARTPDSYKSMYENVMILGTKMDMLEFNVQQNGEDIVTAKAEWEANIVVMITCSDVDRSQMKVAMGHKIDYSDLAKKIRTLQDRHIKYQAHDWSSLSAVLGDVLGFGIETVVPEFDRKRQEFDNVRVKRWRQELLKELQGNVDGDELRKLRQGLEVTHAELQSIATESKNQMLTVVAAYRVTQGL